MIWVKHNKLRGIHEFRCFAPGALRVQAFREQSASLNARILEQLHTAASNGARPWLLGVAACLACASAPASPKAAPLVPVQSVAPGIRVDLRYSREDNAFKHRLYAGNVALLREPVARRLARVQERLQRQGYGLLIWDAYRPFSVQQRMWSLNRQSHSRYLANPRKGSKHNRGAAVDLTLVGEDGRELPMPTPFDEFSPRAHRNAVIGVNPRDRANWRILDRAMRAEGFIGNPYEWWHYTAPEWARYPLANEPVPSRR